MKNNNKNTLKTHVKFKIFKDIDPAWLVLNFFYEVELSQILKTYLLLLSAKNRIKISPDLVFEPIRGVFFHLLSSDW